MPNPFNTRPDVTRDALRRVLGLVRKLASCIGGFSGQMASAADPTCDRTAGLKGVPPLVTGVVTRSGIGSYDCEVETKDGVTIVCSALAPMLHDVYGVSQACVPVPGSSVLVYVPVVGLTQQAVVRGYILGVIPENASGISAAKGDVRKIADTDFSEGGVAQFTESGPAAIASDERYPYKGDYQCGRPHDIVPGEYGLTGHAGNGLVIGALSTEVRGSAMAGVRCSALDDQVRVISGHFRHISSAGSTEIFNDEGYISVESSVSMYQSERMGMREKNKAAFTWKTGDLLSLQERRSGVSPQKATQTAKKRLYRYSGYLGDIENVFVATPDPAKDVEDMSSASLDQGLFHQHLDASGRYTIRSASGIFFERYDRIPIPKRTHYAWDPEGDDGSGGPEEKSGFTIPVQYPMGIGVTMGDMAAWYDYLSYARFRQFTKDFTVPAQKTLKRPTDDYDTIGKAKEDFASYDTRHSYIGLTQNGGIVLRDAWGSEIVMADGRITLNAAANIEIRSGSSVVILGGDDVIAKAYNSVDVSATKKDVRIKAENNLQVVSMKRGVLIQSKAESATGEWVAVGEDLTSAGVVIKADTSSVAIMGQTTEIQGSQAVNVAAFGEDGKPSGDVVLSGKQVTASASDSAVMTAGGSSGVIVSEQAAVLCAPSALAIGGQSAATSAGSDLLVGIPIKGVGPLYAQYISVCKTQADRYLKSANWLNPFSPSVFSSIDFRFRTSEQYGTTKDSGLLGGVFSVYQPSWVLLAQKRAWMKACKTRAWDEGADAKGGYPWPGATAMAGNGYVTYVEKNVSADGIEDPKVNNAVLTPKAFSSYHIRELT